MLFETTSAVQALPWACVIVKGPEGTRLVGKVRFADPSDWVLFCAQGLAVPQFVTRTVTAVAAPAGTVAGFGAVIAVEYHFVFGGAHADVSPKVSAPTTIKPTTAVRVAVRDTSRRRPFASFPI